MDKSRLREIKRQAIRLVTAIDAMRIQSSMDFACAEGLREFGESDEVKTCLIRAIGNALKVAGFCRALDAAIGHEELWDLYDESCMIHKVERQLPSNARCAHEWAISNAKMWLTSLVLSLANASFDVSTSGVLKESFWLEIQNDLNDCNDEFAVRVLVHQNKLLADLSGAFNEDAIAWIEKEATAAILNCNAEAGAGRKPGRIRNQNKDAKLLAKYIAGLDGGEWSNKTAFAKAIGQNRSTVSKALKRAEEASTANGVN